PALAARMIGYEAKQMGEASRPVPVDDILNAQADEFLAEVYRLDHANIQAASFKVYDRMERLLFRASYSLCDRILARANVERFSTTVMRSFLTITWEAMAKLKERKNFYARGER